MVCGKQRVAGPRRVAERVGKGRRTISVTRPAQDPRLWLILAGLGVLGVGAHWGRDFLRIDSCLDAGHVYDYAREVCDTEAYHLPVTSYEARHPHVIRGGALVTLVGLFGAGATWAARLRGKRLVGS